MTTLRFGFPEQSTEGDEVLDFRYYRQARQLRIKIRNLRDALLCSDDLDVDRLIRLNQVLFFARRRERRRWWKCRKH